MIDWFPTPRDAASPDPARELTRGEGMARLRAAARHIDGLDPTTAGHSERVAELAARLAVELGWSGPRVRRLRDAALVHDVGKLAVPRSVLLSPGGLTFEQYALVKEHAAAGARIVSAFLPSPETSWVRHHHERWDGRGYPDGVAGEEIPHGAAILCLADSWDAMRRRAWIGQPLSVAEALEECGRESGHQFAPWAVEALRAVVAAASPRAMARMTPRPAPLQPAA
ncbi:MAG TPA: HD domain-containing phosphohydrolase [Miltoncostaeaceae bacterium]|nr:HD domain-containing phosphohydrolase [Miltoncostaeaceae bacterium]